MNAYLPWKLFIVRILDLAQLPLSTPAHWSTLYPIFTIPLKGEMYVAVLNESWNKIELNHVACISFAMVGFSSINWGRYIPLFSVSENHDICPECEKK
jgi:hypothetical protein